MSVPPELQIKYNSVISVTDVADNVGFFPNDSYLLLEIYGNIKLYQTRKMVQEYLDTQGSDRCVAIRGFGSRGISTCVTMAHLMQQEKNNKRYFTTFSAINRKTKKKITGLQIVIFPGLEESSN